MQYEINVVGSASLLLAAGLMLVLAAALLAFGYVTIGAGGSAPMQWQALAPEVQVGQGVRIAVRLVDGDGDPSLRISR
jgi:hypothetical protein